MILGVENYKFELDKLDLHSIEAKIDAGNRRAIFLLEQLGFVRKCHFNDRMYFEGSFYDIEVV